MRDIFLADTINIGFTTRAFATGIPTVLAGTPVISAYEDASITQITAGITLTVSLDAVVGFNMITIVATGANGFEDNKDYNLVITAGTVGGVSVVGEVVGQFSIQRSPVNWANVSNPTTALDLSGTDIQLVDTATTNTDMITGYATPTNITAGTITTTTNLTNAPTAGDLTATMKTSVTTAATAATPVAASVTGAVGSVTGHTAQTGDTYALANGTAGFVAIDTVVDTIAVDTTTDIPATITTLQSSLNNLTNVGSATNKPITDYTLTTGVQSVGTSANVSALDAVYHSHTHATDAIVLAYNFNIGSGIPSSVTVTGYLNTQADSILVQGYDYVAAAYVTVGTLAGKNASTNDVNSYELFIDMVGSGANEGEVIIRFNGASGMTSATLAVDQIFLSFSTGNEGYDNGSVWADSGRTNTGVEVGIDGVARNAVSTVGAINTLLASTNLHRVQVAPGSTFTFAATQSDEIWTGRDWTLALGGQIITGSFIFGAAVTGISSAASEYELEECDIGTGSFSNAGHFERCGMGGGTTFTLVDAGVYTFHDCFSEGTGDWTIDFATVAAMDVHLFNFHGELNVLNMTSDDAIHITGAGTLITTTCTGGTIDHDGFFEYTDAGGNVTEVQSDIKVAVDAVLVDTADMQPKLGTPAADVSADIAAVKAETAQLKLGIIFGAAATGTLSTTVATTDLTAYTLDQLIGRIITVTSGAAEGESSDITDYVVLNGEITFTAMTLAMGDTDTFKIT